MANERSREIFLVDIPTLHNDPTLLFEKHIGSVFISLRYLFTYCFQAWTNKSKKFVTERIQNEDYSKREYWLLLIPCYNVNLPIFLFYCTQFELNRFANNLSLFLFMYWNYPPDKQNIFPPKGIFQDDVPFPPGGRCDRSLEGIFRGGKHISYQPFSVMMFFSENPNPLKHPIAMKKTLVV